MGYFLKNFDRRVPHKLKPYRITLVTIRSDLNQIILLQWPKYQYSHIPTYGSFFEIFITILYTNTLKPYPTYGSFYPKITSKNMTHKLGYDCIRVTEDSVSLY